MKIKLNFNLALSSSAKRWQSCVSIAILILAHACSQRGDGSDIDDTAPADLVVSATGSVGDALTGAASIQLFSVSKYSALAASSCSSTPFVAACSATPPVSTRTLPDAGCNRGSSANLSYGIITLSFDSTSTCNADFETGASGNFTRTSTNSYTQGLISGYKVLTYTNTDTVAEIFFGPQDLMDFTNTTRSGGSLMTKTAATTSTLAISGIHRRGLRANTKFGFWHTIFTDSTQTLNVVDQPGVSYTVNGSLTVAHNRAGVDVIFAFTNLLYPSDGSCCYPTAGTSTYTVGNQSPVSVTFTSCGQANIGGTATPLPACGEATGT